MKISIRLASALHLGTFAIKCTNPVTFGARAKIIFPLKLLIISHTPHYKDASGTVVGWGPTIREINFLTEIFDEVFHMAPLHAEVAPHSSLPYIERVTFLPTAPTGGPTVMDKIRVFTSAVGMIPQLRKALAQVDIFQFRAPTGIGVVLVPWLCLFSRKKGWFKYAGNWKEPHAPLNYRFQRFLLNSVFTKRKITVNGKWQDQPSHVITFENPALTAGELAEGKKSALQKDFNQKLTLLFVGRIEYAKGVDKLFELLSFCDPALIDRLILVGDGDMEPFSVLVQQLRFPVTLTGGLPRAEINQYYQKAHVLMLPSRSEGFPKVVSEAVAFGCIPAVTDVSSIGQYVTPEHGLLFSSFEPVKMASELMDLMLDKERMKTISLRVTELAYRFTYQHYNEMIVTELISLEQNSNL